MAALTLLGAATLGCAPQRHATHWAYDSATREWTLHRAPDAGRSTSADVGAARSALALHLGEHPQPDSFLRDGLEIRDERGARVGRVIASSLAPGRLDIRDNFGRRTGSAAPSPIYYNRVEIRDSAGRLQATVQPSPIRGDSYDIRDRTGRRIGTAEPLPWSPREYQLRDRDGRRGVPAELEGVLPGHSR